LAQPVFPRRHHRVPRRRLLRQAGTALGDAPEEVGLLEHRDRAGILEVGGRGIEAGREVALAVEVVAVAVHAVADVDLAALRRVPLSLAGSLRSGFSAPGMLDSLPLSWIDAGGAGGTAGRSGGGCGL